MSDDHGRSRGLVLVALYVGQMMITIDNTVVNVALPVIQRDLHFAAASLAWVVNSYLITFGGCLLLAGRLGDLLGRKRVFMAGLVLFIGASMLCGLSTGKGMLIGARLAQGVGAALDTAMILGLVITFYPDARTRGRAMSLYGFVNLAGGSLGLLLGGVITQVLNWHWIFFINLPIGVFTFAVCARRLRPDNGSGPGQSLDVAGAVMITAVPMLVVYGLVNASEKGWASPVTYGCLLGAGAVGGAFLVLESRVSQPLVPLRILGYANLLSANIIRAIVGVGTFGVFFLGVLYMQHVRHFSTTASGIAYTPFTLTSAVFALFISHRMMNRLGERRTLIIGLVMFLVGLGLWALLPARGPYVFDVLPALVVTGLGGGFLTAPNIALCIASAPVEEAGLVSALVNVALQLGGALGIAVLATVAATRSHDLVAHGTATTTALASGYRLGFLVAAAVTVIAVVLAVRLRSPAGPGRCRRPVSRGRR